MGRRFGAESGRFAKVNQRQLEDVPGIQPTLFRLVAWRTPTVVDMCLRLRVEQIFGGGNYGVGSQAELLVQRFEWSGSAEI